MEKRTFIISMTLIFTLLFLFSGCKTKKSSNSLPKIKGPVTNEKGLEYAGVYFGPLNGFTVDAMVILGDLKFVYARANCNYTGYFSKPTSNAKGAKSILHVKKAVSRNSDDCSIKRGRYECGIRLSAANFMALCPGLSLIMERQ